MITLLLHYLLVHHELATLLKISVILVKVRDCTSACCCRHWALLSPCCKAGCTSLKKRFFFATKQGRYLPPSRRLARH